MESEKTSCALVLEEVILNDGSIVADLVDGSFTLADTYGISGNISYFSDGQAVGGVNMKLSGDKHYSVLSGENGSYILSAIEAGSYKLEPLKSDDVRGDIRL